MTEKEEGAQGLTLSSKSNLDSDPTQENILEESIHWRTQGGYKEEKTKWEVLIGNSPSCLNNVAQQYELGTKRQ